jgi:hypothetical protein
MDLFLFESKEKSLKNLVNLVDALVLNLVLEVVVQGAGDEDQ